MPARTLRRFLGSLLLVGALLSPTWLTVLATVPVLQQAGPVAIGFDDLVTTTWGTDEQTVVSDQYANLGVTFNDPMVLDFAGGGFGDPDFVHSGSNAIQQCYGQEKCDTPLVMTFSEPQQRVKVWVGLRDGISDALQVTLTAFDVPQGGDEVASASATLGPSGGQSIPVQVPLEVAAKGTILRAEVTYSPQSDAASQLVIDDVEFEPETGQLACPAGTTAPVITLAQPIDGSKVQIADMTLQGSVTTSAPLTRATLTVANDDGNVPLDVLSSFPQAGGEFGPIVVDDALLEGVNSIALTVGNCADTDEFGVSIEYTPIDIDTQYELLGLEVTQTIQDADNSVRLIADKRTFVRVYLKTRNGESVIHSVSARLRGCPFVETSTTDEQSEDVQRDDVRRDDAEPDNLLVDDVPPVCLGGIDSIPPLSAITVNDTDDRKTQRGNLRMLVDDPETDKDESAPDMNYGLLFDLPPEWIHAGRLRLQLDMPSLSPALECLSCDAITEVEFSPARPLVVNLVDTWYLIDGTRVEPHHLDHQRIASWLERAYPTNDVTVRPLTEVEVPWPVPVCGEINVLVFNGQRAAEISSPSVTPTARARYFGLVRSPYPLADPTFEGCAGVGEDHAYIDQFASGPAGSQDNEWNRWDKDGSYADYYTGHELGHTFLRLHPGGCPKRLESTDEDETHRNPIESAYLSDDAHSDVGFDVGAYRQVDDDTYVSQVTAYPGFPTKDIMTYCDDRWMSSYTYEGIYQRMQSEPAAQPSLAPMPTPAPGQRVLVANGIIDITNGSFIRRPMSVLPGDLVSPLPADSTFNADYTINLIGPDSNGVRRVTSYLFNPRLFTDQPLPPAPQFAQLAEVVPWVEKTDTIEIRSGTTVLETIDVTDPPTVTLTAPNGGETLDGTRFHVTWDSSDPGDASLTHTLLYSTDDGVTWQTAAGNITGEEYWVDPDRLPGSDHARFRVIVTNGVLTAQDDSDAPFTVTDKAPRVDIESPADGATFTSAHTIVLTGHATDVELGKLDATMAWADASQPQNPVPLGTGRMVSVSNLTPGVHTITLTADDGENPEVSTSITITITDANPPHLVWPEHVPSGVRQGQFVYDGDDGEGAFYTTDGSGGIGRVHGFDPLLNGLTAIVPGNFGGDDATDLLFYASQSGVGEFFASTGEGELQLLSGSEGFTRGWDIIVPGDFGGDDWTDLFFYNADDGEGKFYTTNGAGTIRLLSTLRGLPTGWTSMVAGQFGGDGDTDLFFYDAATGLAQLYTTDGEGGLDLLGADLPLDKGWDKIVTGNFGTNDVWLDLFVYDDATGNARFLTADGTGTFAQLGETEPFPAGLTSVIGGEFGGDEALTDLFFYDANAGQGSYYTTDAKGGLEQLSNSGDYPTGWDQIVPGYFARP